jgi:hypothetical protein
VLLEIFFLVLNIGNFDDCGFKHLKKPLLVVNLNIQKMKFGLENKELLQYWNILTH